MSRLDVDLADALSGRTELPAEEVWQAALAAVRASSGPTGLRFTGPRALVLWDTETLGSPRPVLLAPDPRAVDPTRGLAWIAEHEPHTWALVETERYAVSPLASYLVARMTRGVHHVTADATWAPRCAEAGVPEAGLPDLVPPGTEIGVTDPRIVLGLRLPISLAPLSALDG